MSEVVAFLESYFRGAPGNIYLGGYRNPDSKQPKGETCKGIGITQADTFLNQVDRPELENGIYFCTSTLRPGANRREAPNYQSFVNIFADLYDDNHTLPRKK